MVAVHSVWWSAVVITIKRRKKKEKCIKSNKAEGKCVCPIDCCCCCCYHQHHQPPTNANNVECLATSIQLFFVSRLVGLSVPESCLVAWKTIDATAAAARKDSPSLYFYPRRRRCCYFAATQSTDIFSPFSLHHQQQQQQCVALNYFCRFFPSFFGGNDLLSA